MSDIASKLPVYKGVLRPTSWSWVRLTDDLEKRLRGLALKSCPHCEERGFTRAEEVDGDVMSMISPCICVRLNPRD